MAQGIYAAHIQFAKLILQDEKRECAVCFLIIWYDKGKIEKHTHRQLCVYLQELSEHRAQCVHARLIKRVRGYEALTDVWSNTRLIDTIHLLSIKGI